jgi:hypothetical protein
MGDRARKQIGPKQAIRPLKGDPGSKARNGKWF